MEAGKIIDLTMTISNEMVGMEITQAKTVAADGWNASTLTLYSHSGTHMDAPWHFEVNKQTIDELPVSRLVSTAWVVHVPRVQTQELLAVSHLGAVAENFKPGDSILLHTGWSAKVGSDAYRNSLPRISVELAKWFGTKKVNILGVEPPSVADVNDLEEVTEIHRILMENDVIILEGLTNLDAITQPKVQLIALPLKVKKGDGAPARVIVIEGEL